MNTVDIPNTDVKFWTQKNEFPLDNKLRYLTQTEITRQRPFKIMDIEYDRINDGIFKNGMC